MAQDGKQTPSLGRMVHYVLPDGPNAGEHRPAVIVRVWGSDAVNLQVFMDGGNDGAPYLAAGLLWATSVKRSDTPTPRTWHWPEYVPRGKKES